MPRITSIKVNDIEFPLKEYANQGYMIKQLTGIGNLTFDHTEINHNMFFAHGGGRDIGIIIAIKPGADYESIRRKISRATPIDIDIVLTIEVDYIEYAKTICRVREVSFGFSEEMPEVTIDLESIYTCLQRIKQEETDFEIYDLPVGLNAEIPFDTHDYTPVQAVLRLVSPPAQWYRIGLSSDYISINMGLLKITYGITVEEDCRIMINSDEDNFSVIFKYPIINGIEREEINIETACDIGQHGFRFVPNEPMMISTDKIPSSLSGETVSVICTPRISGV